jgi:hypothetical protein
MSQDDTVSTTAPTPTTTSKSKVKRNYSYDDSHPEITLEPTSDVLHARDVVPTTRLEENSPVVVLGTSNLQPSAQVLDTLIQELTQNPNRAVQLIQLLGRITRSWEPVGTNGNPINEVPVPPGKNPKDFVKAATSTVHISGFRLTTIFGDEVATIIKDSPKWRITIQGEYQIDTPFVQHSQRAEMNAKQFAESKLKERGFIIGG